MVKPAPTRVALLLLAACAHAPGSPRARPCPTGDVAIRAQADVDALAGCRAVPGALSIRTAAPIDLRPLDALEEIGGDLAIGPTLALAGVDGFAHLRAIGGALRLSANAEATGAYFPALERAGAVAVDGNLSLAELLAPKLARVTGDVTISHNGALEVVDLGALVVAGRIAFDDNRELGEVHVPALGRAAP
jgi:hypothetical protein